MAFLGGKGGYFERFSCGSETWQESYYKNVVEDLKDSNSGQWYSKIKRMSTIDQTKDDVVTVQQFKGETSKMQAELTADQFASISNLYQPLNSDQIEIPNTEVAAPQPLFEPYQIYLKMKSMKRKSFTVTGDIPWRIISEFSVELALPLCNIYNTSTLAGVWPSSWKYEYVTTVPKVFPTETTEDLRKISGTNNCSNFF